GETVGGPRRRAPPAARLVRQRHFRQHLEIGRRREDEAPDPLSEDRDIRLMPETHVRKVFRQDLLDPSVDRLARLGRLRPGALAQELVHFRVAVSDTVEAGRWKIVGAKTHPIDVRILDLGPLEREDLEAPGFDVVVERPPFEAPDLELDAYRTELLL